MKRRALRSMCSETSRSMLPLTWLRSPISRNFSLKRIPERPARNESSTASRLLPMQEITPSPVMTARRPLLAMSETVRRGEEADPQVLGGVDLSSVHRHGAVRDREGELACHEPFHVEIVGDEPRGRQNLAGELHVTHSESTSASLVTGPHQEKADELPQRVQAETSRHHRVALEVALEEPEVGMHVHLRHDLPPAVASPLRGDPRHAVRHQHVRQGQPPAVGVEQLAQRTGNQLVTAVSTL